MRLNPWGVRLPGVKLLSNLARTSLWITAVCLLSCGCAHLNEASATASASQITAHLSHQLNCRELEVEQTSPDHFEGKGRNEAGGFKISVIRKNGNLTFHGAYEPPAQGTFSGSAAWHRTSWGGFGFHKSGIEENDSVGTP